MEISEETIEIPTSDEINAYYRCKEIQNRIFELIKYQNSKKFILRFSVNKLIQDVDK